MDEQFLTVQVENKVTFEASNTSINRSIRAFHKQSNFIPNFNLFFKSSLESVRFSNIKIGKLHVSSSSNFLKFSSSNAHKSHGSSRDSTRTWPRKIKRNAKEGSSSLFLSLLDTYLGIMDRDRGRVLERHAARVTVKRYRYDRCLGVVEVTEGQFIAARREP